VSINISINGQPRDGIDEPWITRTINGLRHEGNAVCVRVKVQTDDVDIVVTAGLCDGGTGGGRRPRPREEGLLKQWAECDLNHADFELGHLIRCLKRLERAS
jgi:hypothetical protein